MYRLENRVSYYVIAACEDWIGAYTYLLTVSVKTASVSSAP